MRGKRRRKSSVFALAVAAVAALVVVAAGTLILPASGGARTTMRADAAQASGLRAVHRDGQTFVTWTEIGPPPDASSFGNLRRHRDTLEKERIRYRVYRSAQRITDVAAAELIGEVEPLSGWHTDETGRNPADEVAVRRYVIEDSGAEIAPGTGLYVYHPVTAGPAYYAVTVEAAGVENRRLDAGNVTEAVAEAPGSAPPVLQRIERPRSFNHVDNPTVYIYVRWERAENSSRPGQPFGYLVAVPPAVTWPAPVGIHLHEWGANMFYGYGWWFNAEKGAVLVASNQEPYDWWTGYHERFYDGARSQSAWTQGVVRPYTQRRLFAFVDWLGSQLALDRSRTFTGGSSMGGSGSIMLALRHPARIAWAISWSGVHVPRESPQFRSSYELVWGPPEWNVRFEDGTPVWDYYSDVWYLREHPERSMPFVTFSNGKNDGAIGWPQAAAFARALQETRQPHLFVWGQAGHGSRALMPAGGRERIMPLDLGTDQSLPAFTRGSLDDDPGDGHPDAGDPEGQINAWLAWQPESIVDEPDRWAVTLTLVEGAPAAVASADVTPRRLQRFAVRPGDVVSWSNRVDGREVQSGEVSADRWGLVTLPEVQISPRGSRVTIEIRTKGPAR